jgi:hypothetical protein
MGALCLLGDHACVTLFPPTAHFCGTWFQIAMNTLVGLGDLDRDIGGRAVGAVRCCARCRSRRIR